MTQNERTQDFPAYWRLPVLALFFFLFAATAIMRPMLSTLFSTKALWAQESDAVQVCWHIYRASPLILLLTGAIFLAVGLAGVKNAGSGQRIFGVLTVAGGLLSLYIPEAIYAAVCFFIAYAKWEKDCSPRHDGDLPSLLPWPFICNFFLVFAVGILLCSGLESLFTIREFSGKTFSLNSFGKYLILNASLSLAFAVRITFVSLVCLQAFILFLYLAHRYCRLSEDAAVFLFLVAHALALARMIYDLLATIFEDEIRVFAFESYVPLLAILPVASLLVLTWVALCSMAHYRQTAMMNLGEFYYQMLLALGMSLFAPLAGRRRLHLPVAFFCYILAISCLIYLNYPVITDYSANFCLLLSSLIIFCATAVFFLFSYRLRLHLPRACLPFAAGLLVAAMPFGVRVYRHHEVRMITHEYSKIAWAPLHLDLVKTLIAPRRPIGFGKDADFDYFPSVYANFSEDRLEFSTPPPIFVFLLDGMRPDHTSLTGYRRDTTPNIKELAKEGVFFQNAYSAASATTCSLRHIFTGRYSSRFMLEKERLDPFWIQDLIDAGYGTFLLNTFQSDYNGVSLPGFFRKIPQEKLDRAKFVEIKEYDEFPKVEETLTRLREIAAEFGKDPEKRNGIFCYLHGCRPHMPWRPTDKIFGDSEEDRYDAAIYEADQAVGNFIRGLKELGLYENAIMIILADHGTGLMEHGRYGGFLNYEEQIRIPLLIRAPGCRPHVSEEVVQSIDIGPTLVNLVSGIRPNRFHGISLAGVLRGKPLPEPRRIIFAFSAFEDLASLLEDQRYKFHYHRRYGYYQLYDLQNDPGETVNLVDKCPEQVMRYLEVLDRFLRAGNSTYNNPYHYRTFEPNRP